MEIIKDNDGWLPEGNTTYIDDVAYYLYQSSKMGTNEAMCGQWHMMRNKMFRSEYVKAKQFIRLEKLNKIKNNLENR